MLYLNRFIILVFLLVLPKICLAQVSLPAIIGSNMVLQQQSKVPLWGWSEAGQTVSVSTSWNSEKLNVKAGQDGRWQVEVRTPEAGGPYSVTIEGTDEIILKNVMIGEVWLCSGQSNMEMPLKGWPGQDILGSERAIARAEYPDIRLFTVARKTSYEPQKDCDGQWSPCSVENAGDFSAVGFFFGVDLYKKLKVPIGLIHSSWGGTPAEAWTNQKFIDKLSYFHTDQSGCDAQEFQARKLKDYESVQREWLNELGFVAPDEAPDWTLAGYNTKDWQNVEVPATWNETEVGDYLGTVELRYEFRTLPGWTKKTTLLNLGPIDEMDIVWINGIQVGSHLNIYDWAANRTYEIPPGVLKKGKNTLAVQVANTSGVGGINGDPKSVNLYPKGQERLSKSLAGNWKFRKAKSFSDVSPMPWCNNCADPQTPTTLYNGMIAPLIPYKIKGAIWYQGESNRYDGKLYGEIFPNMIANWRNDWRQGDFPFYFVQIAPFSYSDEFSTGLLREAQFNSMKSPKTGMVVTMDIGSLRTIHPPDKETVGVRLATWALARDYGFKNLSYSGPLYKSYTIEKDKIRIHFNYICGGLQEKGGELKHFLIAGPDRIFVPAKAIIDKNTILVYSEMVKNPVAVRFGWGHTDETNLFNAAGLPAGPFRTDEWN